MYPVPANVSSPRLSNLAAKLADKQYRDAYMSTQLRTWLAEQVRALRGGMSQKDFGKKIGKPQTVVSRLENPEYGKLTLETLLDVASKLDIALLVRFVDYPTFLIATEDSSDAALRPTPYNQIDIGTLWNQPIGLHQFGTAAINAVSTSTAVNSSGAIYTAYVPGDYSSNSSGWVSSTEKMLGTTTGGGAYSLTVWNPNSPRSDLAVIKTAQEH